MFIYTRRVQGVIKFIIPPIDLNGAKSLDVFCVETDDPDDDDAPSSGELSVPDSVKKVYLHGYTIEGIPVAPVLKFRGEGLTSFNGYAMSFESVKALCAQAPLLTTLCLNTIPGFDANGMDKWVSPGLTTLMITSCRLTEVPANIGTMFPFLTDFGVCANQIKTLKGVELPPQLDIIHLSYNAGITLEGANFSRVSRIWVSGCQGLRGLSIAKFPDSLEAIDVRGCDIRWLGSSFRWPKSVKTLLDEENPLIDIQWKSWDPNFFYYTIEHRRANKVYGAEDCIGLMRRWNVLSYDLLRTLRKFF